MRALSLFVLMTLGCGSDLLGPDLEHRFTRLGACADVLFYAVDSDDEVMLTFYAGGLVAAAREAGTETSTVVTFPSENAQLILEQGSHISDATCDDVIEGSGPRVERSWTAASGTATVRIRAMGDEWSGGRGDLVLDDIVFGSAGSDELRVVRLEWEDVSVGWFPG